LNVFTSFYLQVINNYEILDEDERRRIMENFKQTINNIYENTFSTFSTIKYIIFLLFSIIIFLFLLFGIIIFFSYITSLFHLKNNNNKKIMKKKK